MHYRECGRERKARENNERNREGIQVRIGK